MTSSRVQLTNKQEDAHDDGIWCSTWVPDSSSLVTGSIDESVRVWTVVEENQESIEAAHTYTGHTLGVVSVAVDVSGTYAASSALDSFIRVWNMRVCVPSPNGASLRVCPACSNTLHAGDHARTLMPSLSCSRPGQQHEGGDRDAALRDLADQVPPGQRQPHPGRGRRQQQQGRDLERGGRAVQGAPGHPRSEPLPLCAP